MGWAIFLGGCAQLIAGLIDLRKNHAFGGTAFIAYGLFWLAMAFGWATTNGMFGSYAAERSIRAKQEPLSWRTSS